MLKSISLTLLLFVAVINYLDAQKTNLEDLFFYADVMVHADAESHRLKALEEFKTRFEGFLDQPSSYSIPLENTPYISTLIPPDSSFKLFTFQINERFGKSTDFGYIQLKEDNSYFALQPTSDLEDIEYEELGTERWVSGLYYHMVPFVNDGKNHYLLFAYSQPSLYEKRKVLEVLSFDQGKPVFGAPVLIKRQETARNIEQYRKIYRYSADVSMTIRDDQELGAVVIDHLMEVRSRIPGVSGNTFVPDGTYTAYFKDGGDWIYKDKLWGAGDVRAFKKEEPEQETKSRLFKNRND